jgi:hypothetical protein
MAGSRSLVPDVGVRGVSWTNYLRCRVDDGEPAIELALV